MIVRQVAREPKLSANSRQGAGKGPEKWRSRVAKHLWDRLFSFVSASAIIPQDEFVACFVKMVYCVMALNGGGLNAFRKQ